MYQRVYVKFLDTVNKREYVRLCSRKPRCKPMNSLRYAAEGGIGGVWLLQVEFQLDDSFFSGT